MIDRTCAIGMHEYPPIKKHTTILIQDFRSLKRVASYKTGCLQKANHVEGNPLEVPVGPLMMIIQHRP